MTTISDVRTIGVTVRGQDRALEFWTDRLGFETRMNGWATEGMRRIEVAAPGAATSIALVAGDTGKGPADTGVRFTVPDATAEHAAMRATDVAVSDLLTWEGVPPMFTFDDPDGNRFQVVEAASW